MNTKFQFALLIAALLPTTSHATVLYDFDRVIGAGSAIGSIQTDGTLGVLATSNIVGYSFVISAPNLNGGPTWNFEFGEVGGFVDIEDVALTASGDGLFFDFSAFNGHLVFSSPVPGTDRNFYCILAGGATCGGPGGTKEVIGRTTLSDSSTKFAQRADQAGLTMIASRSVNVPEPSTFGLLGVGLFGIGLMRRKRAAA